MDRTKDWHQAVEAACRQLEVPEASILQLKARMLMKSKRTPNAFMSAVVAVLQTIHELREFIKLHQEGYLGQGIYSDQEKDQIELEVAALVKECARRVDQLTQQVLAAQRAAAAAAAGGVNEQTAAHRHGAVLSMAEQLHAVSARFDRFRAQRFQQAIDAGSRAAQLAAVVAGNTAMAGSQGKRGSSGAGGPPAGLLAASKLGGVVFMHVKGATQALLQGATNPQGGGGLALVDGDVTKPAPAPQPTAQQIQLQEENQELATQLMRTAGAVHSVERSVQEIATLNQMFSAAVLSQAESIEAIYANAVQASVNLKRGNVEIKKTIQVNRSSQRFMFVLLLVATLGLLFLDWFNS